MTLLSQFSQASTARNTASGKRFPSLNFRHPLESKGSLKFRLKDFPRFKVDRLQIMVVAKKYISTWRNCSSGGCLKCVRACVRACVRTWVLFNRFPISIDEITWSLTILSISIFIYWLLREVTTRGTNDFLKSGF